MPLLEARGIWFAYRRGEYVLRGVNLEVDAGEVVAVLGPTGSGKTTLLLVLAGLLEPERGSVLVNGCDARDARRYIGIVFQNPDDQLFNPTVYDEIAYAPRSLGLGEEEVQKLVLQAARLVGVEHLLDRPPYRLSMGEKRLVSLASILVYKPRLILLDEPFTFLDPRSALRVACILVRLVREERTAVVMATHNVETALILADRLCALKAGRLECGDVKLDARELVATNPALAYALSRGELENMVEQSRRILHETCGVEP